MKILFPVMALYPDESGGISLSLYWLLRGLYSTKKIETTTITTNHGIEPNSIPLNTWIDSDYGKVIYLKTKNSKISIEIIKVFIDKVKETDIVHLSSIFYPPSIICFFISMIYGKKIIWSIRGSIDDVEFKKNGVAKKIVLEILKLFSKKITFHVTSEDEANFTKKRFGEKAKIIQIINYMIIPRKIAVPKEEYFLYIGRFHHKKGIDNLLKSLKLSNLFLSSDFKLKIAGDYNNEYGKYILKLHKELCLGNKVQFLGHVTGSYKQILLAKAFFLFMPSYSENFGNVVVESLAQGTPVVASIYTPWKILNDFHSGFWVDNSPEALANTIDNILNISKDEYNKYTHKTLEVVNSKLNIESNIHRWVQAYNFLH